VTLGDHDANIDAHHTMSFTSHGMETNSKTR